MPISAAISSGSGARPRCGESSRSFCLYFAMVSTMWTGMRIVRDWSASARVLAYLAQIHLHGIISAVGSAILELLALKHELGGIILEHSSAFKNIYSGNAEALVYFFEQEHVVFD